MSCRDGIVRARLFDAKVTPRPFVVDRRWLREDDIGVDDVVKSTFCALSADFNIMLLRAFSFVGCVLLMIAIDMCGCEISEETILAWISQRLDLCG